MFKPNWDNIQDPATFHDLLNELFLAELNFTSCKPGAPRRGQDRGFDLLHPAAMPTIYPDMTPGLWMIQAKFTTKDLTPACDHLKQELLGRPTRKGEIDKALEAGADYLLVVTQAELQADHQEQLEALAPAGNRLQVKIMCRQKLDLLLAPKAWLLRRYFGAATYPGLVPVHSYRDGSESLPMADLPFLGRSAALEELKATVGRGVCRVVVVHAPGGIGKTRFLLEAAGQAHTLFPDRQVYFYHSRRPAQDTINDELPPQARYLIIIDDAERDFEDRTLLFMRIASSGEPDVVFILACRDGATKHLEKKLVAEGVHRRERLRLEPLDRDMCLKILRQATDLDDPQRRRLYRATSGNLFLLGASVAAIKEGNQPFSFATDRDIKAHLVDRLQRQADHALRAVRLPLPRELLPAVALLAPFPHNRGEDLEFLGSLVGEQDLAALEGILDVLRNAGILRRVGWRTRFAADMLGDFVLEHNMDRPDHVTFVKKVVEPAIGARPDPVITNLVYVGGLGNETARSTLISVLDRWTREERLEPTTDRDQRLKAVGPMAGLVPEQVIEFLEAVVMAPVPRPEKQRPRDRREVFRRALNGEKWVDALTTDQVCPALAAAGTSPLCVGQALELLRRIVVRVGEGMFDNHKPLSIVSNWMSPVYKSSEYLEAALDKLGLWLCQPALDLDTATVTLAFEGLQAVLKTCWHYEEHEPGRLVFGPRAMLDSPPLRAIRSRALDILTGSLSHDSPTVRQAAAQAAGKIGEPHPAFRGEVLPLEDLAAEEKVVVFHVIAERIQEEQELSVLYAMEDVLLESWLLQSAGSDVAEEALSSRSRPTELKVLRWTRKPWDAFDSFKVLRQQAPNEDRWSWWVQKKHDARTDTALDKLVESFVPLAEEIEHSFPGVAGFISLMNRLVDGGYDGSGMVPPWLWSVASRSPGVLHACLHDTDVADQVPEQFTGSLRSVWSATAQDAFSRTREQLPESLVEAEPGDVHQLLHALTVAPDRPDDNMSTEVLKELAGHPVAGVRVSIVDWHVNIRKVPSDRRMMIYAAALGAGYDRQVAQKIWRDIEHHVVREGGEVKRRGLRDVVVQAFIQRRGDQEDTVDTVLPNLLLWCLREDTGAWLEVLERRLRSGGDLWGLKLASGHMGMRQEPIHSIEDLTLTLTRLANWKQEELIDEVQHNEFQKWIGSRDYAATNEYVQRVILEHRELDHLTCARLLSDRYFGEQDQVQWLGLLRSAYGKPTWSEVARKFMDTAGFVRTYSSTMGQDPPALTGRLAELRRLKNQIESDEQYIALLIEDAIQEVGGRIEHHRRDEQEMLDPR